MWKCSIPLDRFNGGGRGFWLFFVFVGEAGKGEFDGVVLKSKAMSVTAERCLVLQDYRDKNYGRWFFRCPAGLAEGTFEVLSARTVTEGGRLLLSGQALECPPFEFGPGLHLFGVEEPPLKGEGSECPSDEELRLDIAKALAFRECSWVNLLREGPRQLELTVALHVRPFPLAAHHARGDTRIVSRAFPYFLPSAGPPTSQHPYPGRRRDPSFRQAKMSGPIPILPLPTRLSHVQREAAMWFSPPTRPLARVSHPSRNMEDERLEDYVSGFRAGFQSGKSGRAFPSVRELNESFP
ncbi:hypothetical protein QJS10_CPA08g00553 [Acorus calamus]|uniref:Uncharacterized protein n=1 Tax=Acorus calamus TaxID=4465 RepID=A0AAV9E870_ACOCL|nr:hypothetical protein QJS10_CPA08g00553 [Acorus calamus]